jgi:hypothetical protein
MSFFSNIISATVKVALTPIAIVQDAVSVTIGAKPNATKELLEDAGKDAIKSLDDLTGNS